jgi:hypothetical protein
MHLVENFEGLEKLWVDESRCLELIHHGTCLQRWAHDV